MLYALALAGQSPRAMGRLSSEKVPANGIHLSIAAMLLGVVLNGLIPERIFGYVIDTVLVTQLWTWSMILIAHLQFRRAVAKGLRSPGSFRLPLSPFANWLVLGYIGTITVVLCTDPATAIVRYLIPIWFGTLLTAYALTRSAARASAAR
jgi:AAT family amino acid transporter/D-serine/D-alanine/glycine transporter